MKDLQLTDKQSCGKPGTTLSTNDALPKRRDRLMYLDEAKRTIKQYNKLINNG